MIAIDTGFFFALADRRDEHHRLAKLWIDSARDGWVTTWPVITETCHLLEDRISDSAKIDFMQEIMHGGIMIWDLPADQARKIPAMMKKYTKLPMDLADASLVLLAEHLGHGRILTTDQRDFGAYRWKSTKPFVNLLEQA